MVRDKNLCSRNSISNFHSFGSNSEWNMIVNFFGGNWQTIKTSLNLKNLHWKLKLAFDCKKGNQANQMTGLNGKWSELPVPIEDDSVNND